MWCSDFAQLLLFSGGLLSFCALSLSDTQAQVIPDRSLGDESSLVNSHVMVKDAIADLIAGGAIRDRNLFHSFRELSINEGGRVYFASPAGINNIITRVTGNNVSEILGTVGVDGGANLWLLNPNGIVFGNNATLDVSGSFLATTADSYVFANGFNYSATDPDVPPLLTIDIPLGVQFGNNIGDITVKGKGHNLGIVLLDDFTTTLLREDRTTGLEVRSRNTLALLGGKISLEGAYLATPGGRIELGSVVQPGFVSLIPTDDGFTFDYQAIEQFGDLSLTEATLVDVSGRGGGNLQVRGNNIGIFDTSAMIANTLGDRNGGNMNIHASEAIDIQGIDELEFPSGIFNEVEANAEGQGNNLTIIAQKLNLSNNAWLSSQVFGSGDGGNLQIIADEIKLSQGENSYYETGIFSDVLTEATGNGGNINIDARTISLSERVIIGSDTFGFGNGGKITINTDLLLLDNADIVAGTWGTGNSGQLEITATEIELTGEAGLYTDVVADVEENAAEITGQGGELIIHTEQLRIYEGSQIRAGTTGAGDGGNLTIQAAEAIEIRGASLTEAEIERIRNNSEQEFELEDEAETEEIENYPSGIFVGVDEEEATGNGGSLAIATPYLQIANGGTIAANVFGSGNGGEIKIEAETIEVSQSSIVDDARTGITSTVELEGTGNGGNIDIFANNLSIFDGGSISSSAKGNGDAGNVQIWASKIDVRGKVPEMQLNSQIAAFSESQFDGGLIVIHAEGLSLRDNAAIKVGNQGGGNSGNLALTASYLLLDDSTIDAQISVGEQGNITLNTDNIVLKNQSDINISGTVNAMGGNISITNTKNIVLMDGSQIVADAVAGNGGNIDITTQGLFISLDSKISASSQFGLDGYIDIETINGDRKIEFIPLPIQIIDATQKITSGCGVNSDFIISNNGGLPENPTQNLRSQTVWQDTRLITANYSDLQTESDLNSPSFEQTPVIEAQAWKVNHRGNIELFATTANSSVLNNSHNCYSNQ